jgi:transcriptional regulator with XRE-family HTH domain
MTRKVEAHFRKNDLQDRPEEDTENTIDAHVGSRIRRKRIMLGFTEALLSDALGVSVSQLTKWETGANRVGAERLRQISEILQEPASAFFAEFEPKRAIAARIEWSEPPGDVSSESLELFSAFSRIIDPESRRKVIAFATSLAPSDQIRN